MCIIAICENGTRLNRKMFDRCFDGNSDGAGFSCYTDGYVYYSKGYMTNKSAWKAYKMFKEFPHVAHFRLNSAGGVCKELTHPFLVEQDSPISMSGYTSSPVLFHNGTIMDWKQMLFSCALSIGRMPEGKMSDTRVSAMVAGRIGLESLEYMSGKFAVVHSDKIEKYGTWDEDEGIFYSNMGYKRASYSNTFSSYTWDEKNHEMKKVTNVRDYRAMYQMNEIDDSYAGWGKGSYGVEHYRRPKQIAFQANKEDDDDKEEELTLDNIRTGRDGGIL